MLLGVNHIGIAVKSLDEARKVYVGALGAEVGETHSFPESGMNVIMVSVGNTKLELMESTGAPGPVTKFLETRGEGVQHICLEVDDIEKHLKELAAKGIRLIDKEPRQGIEGRIAFLHPKDTNGVLVELVEVPREHPKKK